MTQLISVEDALRLIKENSVALVSEAIPLEVCHGRTLAEPVIAKVSRPPSAVSAMDGYAVRLEDVREAGARLEIIGEAPAGVPFLNCVDRGHAVRIFTGAEVPPGADHIVLQECVETSAQTIFVPDAYDTPAHIRLKGLDFAKGDTLLDKSTRIGAAELALSAAANYASLQVYKRPKVAILANGDELRPPGSDLMRGQIINSNPAALATLVRQWGGDPLDLGIASDTIASIQAYVEKASQADIIVPIGGASVGDHDHMRRAFHELGYKSIFEKIAVRPGKPTWFAVKDHQRVLGLPGNPASALVCAYLFLSRLVNPAHTQRRVTARLGTALNPNGARKTYLRARAFYRDDGYFDVTPADNQDSSLLSPFLQANCLIEREAHAASLDKHGLVKVILIGDNKP